MATWVLTPALVAAGLIGLVAVVGQLHHQDVTVHAVRRTQDKS